MPNLRSFISGEESSFALMNDEALAPKPRLDIIKPDLLRLKTAWMICSASPILYLFLADLVRTNWFEGGKGLANLSALQDKYLIWSVGAVVCILELVLLMVRFKFQSKLDEAASSLSTLIRTYTKRTFIMIALCETTAVLGFIVFLMDGHLPIICAFGIASMMMYAQSYPSERGLAAAARKK